MSRNGLVLSTTLLAVLSLSKSSAPAKDDTPLQLVAIKDRVKRTLLFSRNQILVLDPVSGDPILDTTLDRGIAKLPSWQIYDTGTEQAFLAYAQGPGEETHWRRYLAVRAKKIV